MAEYIVRVKSKKDVDRAGFSLKTLDIDSSNYDEIISTVDNWRSCHAYPLQAIKMTLLKRAKRINSSSVIAQRLKRLPSIFNKLVDNPNMKLTQMQDIGGCRAIMGDVYQVNELSKLCRERGPVCNDKPHIIEEYDYIKHPKPDGYRSVHLIYKYQTKSAVHKAFSGQRIEVQIRSQLQHAWATALEIAETFSGQALKRKSKVQLSNSWVRFFTLMSAAIAYEEKTAQVPGVSNELERIVSELKDLDSRHRFIHQIEGYRIAASRIPASLAKAAGLQYILIMDTGIRSLRILPVSQQEARDVYVAEERKAATSRGRIQVVQVNVANVEALQKAYPNYYGDTSVFVRAYKGFADLDFKQLTFDFPDS